MRKYSCFNKLEAVVLLQSIFVFLVNAQAIEDMIVTQKVQNETLKTQPELSTSTSEPISTSSVSIKPTQRPDYIDIILKTKETNIKKIFELLRKEQAEKCVYGPNPSLDDLCPDLMNVPSYSSIPHLKQLNLSDVKSRIIDHKIVVDLIEQCAVGEWCLTDELLSLHSSRPDTNMTLVANGNSSLAFLSDPKLFCLIESCFESIKYYVEKCVEDDLVSHVVQLAPKFCNFEIENYQNDFCIENSLRLLHVSAAFYELSEEVKAPTPDVCLEEIKDNKCSTECKSIAKSIDKITSCCTETKLIRNFKSFDWYFNYQREVRHTCDLPIKSICLSEGKYYLGISPKILVLSIVCSVLTTALLVMVVFLVCCRQKSRLSRNHKHYETSDIYEYAHLNPGMEDDDVTMANVGLNDEFEIESGVRYQKADEMEMDGKAVFLDLNNNGAGNDISRFVNKHQTDIRSLFS